MNYDNEKHIIEYIEGKKVKQFKVPKNDYNLDFNKMSYNDILTYIKLVQEQEPKNDKIKYKPLKTVAAKTKDYFAQDFKLMSQAEKLKTISEYMLNENIQELKEFLTNDVFTDEPIVQSLMTILNKRGYLNDEVKELLRNKKDIDLYTSVIKHCIVKTTKGGSSSNNDDYSFVNITFKNTIGDILDLSKQFRFLQNYTIFVPFKTTLFENGSDKDTIKDNVNEFNDYLFKGIKSLSSKEGREIQQFMTNEYIKPNPKIINKFVIHGFNNFKLNLGDKTPYYIYDIDNELVYLNIKYLYYLLQHDEAFKNNNYKYVVEKLQRNEIDNIIFTAGSAFDLDHINLSLSKYTDETINYYDEYVKLMSETLAKYFNKKFTPVVKTIVDDSEDYMDFSDIDKPKDLTEDLTEDDLIPIDEATDKKPTIVEPEHVEPVKPIELKPLDEEPKEGKGLFRRDTRETLKALLNRIIKLESLVSEQAEQIKQLKNGIRSINQALPDEKRKEVFGNYFSNSVGGASATTLCGALNPNKVYPKITFTEFKKLYNEL